MNNELGAALPQTFETPKVQEKSQGVTLAQWLADNAGQRFINYTGTVAVSGSGDVSLTLFPSGNQGQARTFRVVDDALTLL